MKMLSRFMTGTRNKMLNKTNYEIILPSSDLSSSLILKRYHHGFRSGQNNDNQNLIDIFNCTTPAQSNAICETKIIIQFIGILCKKIGEI